MKTISASLLLSCLLACAASAAFAEEETSAATAHRLMIRSGLAVQLRSLPAQIEADIQRSRGQLDEKMAAALLAASREAFAPAVVQEDMTARVAKKLTMGDMKAALVWLESEAGQRVTRAEELASATLDEQRVAEFVRTSAGKPLSDKRPALLSDIIRVTDATQNVIATQEAMALGVAVGLDTLQPRERRQGEAVLRERVRQMLPADKMRAVLAQQLPVLYAYTYRNVSDADLARYLGFLKSPAGKRYQDGMMAAFVEGLGRASLRVGELAAQQQRQTAM